MPLRRTMLAASAATLAVRALPAIGITSAPAHTLAQIEARSGGRLGVYGYDTGNGRSIAYRAEERFPMCSTFKILAVAAVLQRVDAGLEHLGRYISFGAADIEAYAPVTTEHIAQGRMTVADLCRAAITLSDNTAANLLLRAVGGPHHVTEFVRAQPFNDMTTRLDRNEPAVNTAIAGDVRDTTTAAHMALNLALLLKPKTVLSERCSRLLEKWMHDCETGTAALRAGAPSSWYAGDKTGSGENGTRNDVAIFRPPQRARLIVAAYLTEAGALSGTARDAVLADVGRAVITALA